MSEERQLINELRDTIPATQDMAHTMQGDRQERAADTIERLIRERDEARAEAKKAKQDYDDLYELDEQTWVAEAKAAGYRRGLQDAARLAQEHRARVPNHHPDKPMDDLVAQGYGNAALNLERAILALLEQTDELGEKK